MTGRLAPFFGVVLCAAVSAGAQTNRTTVYSFKGANGLGPCAAVAEGTDGKIYGVTTGGGANFGEVFRIDPAGVVGNYTPLHTFPFDGSEGTQYGPLVQALDGNFYTTAAGGGAFGQGAIVRVSTAGQVTVLHSFDPANPQFGLNPLGGLTLAPDGALYGTTNQGGDTGNNGTVFKITTSGTFTTLKVLTFFNGSRPLGPPVKMPDGLLYGLAGDKLYSLTTGGTYTVIATGLPTSTTASDITGASDGNLYYTRRFGGPGRGDVVRLSTMGNASTLYSFMDSTPGAPAYPNGGVLEGPDGALWGTTPYEGTGHPSHGYLYSISKSGVVERTIPLPSSDAHPDTVRWVMHTSSGDTFVSACRALYRFRPSDGLVRWKAFESTGGTPRAALIEGADGHLYGTTHSGGFNGRGTAFRLTRTGILTTLASFDLANQGPNSELVRASDGTLYGTTEARTVFRVSPDGTVTTLKQFPAEQSSGGGSFHASLAAATNGMIYGVTSHGEQDLDCGTAFTLSPSGAVTVIGVFRDVCHPLGQLVRGPDGHFYGKAGSATFIYQIPPVYYFYRLTTSGVVTAVASSTVPATVLNQLEMQTKDGTVFGVSESGGPYNGGYIYRLAPSLTAVAPSLQFGATSAGSSFLQQTPDQTVRLTQLGEGTITWSAAVDQPWLRVSPAGGSGSGTITVGVQHVPGFTAAGAFANVTIPVTLTVAVIGNNSAPAGLIDTPLDNVTVSGSIAVTGWAVDDLGISAVRIFRDPVGAEPAGTLVFVGNAVRVEGARPDVAAAFPNLPGASLAGWGYLLLTNMLPAQGNGTFRLHAFAEDVESNSTLLGTRTIIAANSAATTPFGAIDTPGQGDIVSGANYANFGWVLSPGSRRADPTGGGSVSVLIDGVPVGSPGGWTSRSDLSALFPQAQYEGVTNALGVFSIDTTSLANGVHTIAWAVTDNQGASAGIGSRYFTVVNGPAPLTAPAASPSLFGVLSAALDETVVRGRVGVEAQDAQSFPVIDGTTVVRSAELQRLELQLRPENEIDRLGRRYTGYLRVGDDLRPLPFGARLDPATGVFTWQPGVGFAGSYDLTFVQWLGAYSVARQDVRVVFEPKSR